MKGLTKKPTLKLMKKPKPVLSLKMKLPDPYKLDKISLNTIAKAKTNNSRLKEV